MPKFNTVAERDAYYANKIKAAGSAPAINPESSSVTYNKTNAGDGSWINSRSTATNTSTIPTAQTTQTQTAPANTTTQTQPVDTRTDAQKAADLAASDKLAIRAQEESGRKAQNEIATETGLEKTPVTIEEIVAKQKETDVKEKTNLQRQLDYQRSVDQAQQARFNEQAKGSIGATTAAYAQGREGAMAGGAVGIRNEFTTEINKQIEENRLRLVEAQAQRDSLMVQLEQAQKNREIELAESLSKSLAQAEQTIKNNKTNYINALSTANEQARLAQQSTQQAVSTFTGLVDKGTVMSPQTIISMANTLQIPFEVAYGYYSGADAIRNDKSLSVQEKAIKLQDTAMDFQERIQGIRSEEAKSVADYTKLVKSGLYSPEELSNFASSMKISSENNPVYQLDLRIKTAQAKKDEYEAKYLGKEPPKNTKEWYEYKQAQLDLEKSQFELDELKGVNNTDTKEYDIDNVIKEGSTSLPSTGKQISTAIGNGVITGYGSSKWDKGLDFVIAGGMGADVTSPIGGTVIETRTGHKRGEANSFGNQVKIQTSTGEQIWLSHLESVNVNKGDVVQAGQVIGGQGNTGTTLGKTGVHVDITMKNKNGNYYDSKQVAAFLTNIANATPTKTGAAENTYNKYLKEAKANGLKSGKANDNAAEKWATEQTKKAMENGDIKALPDVYNWAGQVINNTFGDTEGGKKALRKIDELATAIANKDGKTAKSAVYNAMLEGIDATERKDFSDAITLDDAYKKTQEALADFKKAGLTTGLYGNTMSEIYKAISAKSPDEAIRLKTRLKQSFNAYRKAITGAGASMGELASLEDSVPTFNKNLDEIQVMTDMAQADARDSLNRKVNEYSKGTFSDYQDYQDRMDELLNIGKAEKAQATIKGFLDFGKSLIEDHANSTGEYIVPEEHKINKYDF